MSFNEPQAPRLESQPFRKIFTTLLTTPPMNLDAFGAILFVVSLILTPSGVFLNLVFAALAAYIVYGAVKRAEVHTALKDVTFQEELPSNVRHFFVKPRPADVVKQMFRSVFNLIFLVGIVLSLIGFISNLLLTPVPVLLTISDAVLILVYLLFMISNGYTRAQMVQAYGKRPSLLS